MPQYVNSSKTCRITETDMVNDLDVLTPENNLCGQKINVLVVYFKQFWKIQLHSLMEKGTYFNANHYFLFKLSVFLSNLQ